MLSLSFVVLAATAYAQEYTFSNEATSTGQSLSPVGPCVWLCRQRLGLTHRASFTVYTVTQDTGSLIIHLTAYR